MSKNFNYNYAFLFYDIGEKKYIKYLKYAKSILSIIKNLFFAEI